MYLVQRRRFSQRLLLSLALQWLEPIWRFSEQQQQQHFLQLQGEEEGLLLFLLHSHSLLSSCLGRLGLGLPLYLPLCLHLFRQVVVLEGGSGLGRVGLHLHLFKQVVVLEEGSGLMLFLHSLQCNSLGRPGLPLPPLLLPLLLLLLLLPLPLLLLLLLPLPLLLLLLLLPLHLLKEVLVLERVLGSLG
jgi:hypothetical protein